MRILVIADIHANWPALSAINEQFDACLFLGDLVEYGPQPVPCIDWVRSNATAAIRGNHDHATAQRVTATTGPGFRKLAGATRELNGRLLRPTDIKYLSRLPVTQSLCLGGKRFYLVHATPRDPMDEYLTNDTAAWAQRLEEIDADYVCVGHTHLQFTVEIPTATGTKTVLNPGSVGQPRDGDPRAAYAIIENGRIELKRVPYDIDAAVDQLRAAELPDDVFELAEHVLRTGGRLPAKSADGPADQLPA